MKIFEFQFNPKAKKDRFFRVFSKEPAKGAEAQGSMYIVCELANALPTNSNFLERLSNVIEQEYYDPEKQPQAAAQRLKSALKKANSFLAEESKGGNVDWLGNLHFLLLLFAPTPQGYTLYFTKVGGMKLWMSRAGSLVDAGKSIESAKNDEGSVKIFGNVGSGRIIPGDRIIGLTPEAFEFFSKENFLQAVAQLHEEKQFRNMFEAKQKEMSQLMGILFFVLAEALEPANEEKKEGQSAFVRWSEQARLAARQVKFPQLKIPALPLRLPQPVLMLPSPSFLRKKLPFLMLSEARKRMGLLALLLFVLLLGFAILGGKSQRDNQLEQPEEQEQITAEMRVRYNIVDIEQPEVAAILPDSPSLREAQRMIQLGSKFYFFNSSSPNIAVFDGEVNASETLNTGKTIKLGTSSGNSLLFFAEPDTMVFLNATTDVVSQQQVAFPADAQFGGMEQYAGNLYFFDARSGDIFRSPIPQGESVTLKRWFDPLSPKKPINARAMGIDGNVWILTEENEIQRYFRGSYQESLNLDIVPAFCAVRSLKTTAQLPYLYLLEPAESRVVILSKSGQVLRQYMSPAFTNVRDFTVSPDGQTLYLFDGAKLYRISPVVY